MKLDDILPTQPRNKLRFDYFVNYDEDYFMKNDKSPDREPPSSGSSNLCLDSPRALFAIPITKKRKIKPVYTLVSDPNNLQIGLKEEWRLKKEDPDISVYEGRRGLEAYGNIMGYSYDVTIVGVENPLNNPSRFGESLDSLLEKIKKVAKSSLKEVKFLEELGYGINNEVGVILAGSNVIIDFVKPGTKVLQLEARV